LLHRFVYKIPTRWRKGFSSLSIVKLCYDFIMLGYSPTVSYKNLLTQQEKLLDSINETEHESEHESKYKHTITVVIELSVGYQQCLQPCIDSLIQFSNEIDSLCFVYDVIDNKEKQNQEKSNNTHQQSINTMLASLLVNSPFSYTLDSKDKFVNNIANTLNNNSGNGDAVVWCQTPVIFYPFSFKVLLDSYSEDGHAPAVIYSDHDILNNGTRTSPAFKPALNIDWLLCSNYMGRMILFNKTQLVSKLKSLHLPLYRKKTDGGKVDLLHALLKEIATDSLCSIKHVFFVLYSEQNFDEVTDVEVKNDTVTTPPVERIHWPLPKNLPFVSIIIPTRNEKQLVQQCIESLYKLTYYNNFEVLLIDNESDDAESIEYFQQLHEDNKVKLLNYNAPFNYSAINNFAVHYAKGDVLLFMNNDIALLHDKWLEEMVMQVMREDIGCVGAKLYYPNMTIQHAGVIVGLWGCAGHSHKNFKRTDNGYMNRLNVVQNYSAVTAACMAVRKTVFNEVKGFNEQDLAVAFNDVDLCLKIQSKGYRNLWTPYAEMTHHESISRGSENTPEKKAREANEIAYMRNTWHLDTIVDPAYNPWLTHQKEDFSFVIEKR
jgi:GT2 family glycosyltransferase